MVGHISLSQCPLQPFTETWGGGHGLDRNYLSKLVVNIYYRYGMVLIADINIWDNY